MKKPFDTIFLDLDGTLVDFRGAALKVCGATIGANDSPEYSLSRATGISSAELWAAIDAVGPGFWRYLPKYPWADELLAALPEWSDDIVITTSPTWHWSSFAGKRLWLQDQFGESFGNYIFTQRKELLARTPNSVLIDDSQTNAEKFRAAGGLAILVPQVWNDGVLPPGITMTRHIEHWLHTYCSMPQGHAGGARAACAAAVAGSTFIETPSGSAVVITYEHFRGLADAAGSGG
jgi:5'(3')-deoxyribonucleotidase